MCSVENEEDAPTELVPNPTPKEKKALKGCNRCKTEQPKVILRGKHGYCLACFDEHCYKKFRSFLGKNRVAVGISDTKVMIAFSGGPSSRALVEMCKRCVTEVSGGRKLFFHILLVHIDESAVLGSSPEEIAARHEEFYDIAKSLDLPIQIIPLEELYKGDHSTPSTTPTDARSRLIANFAAADSITVKEDLLESLRMHLLFKVAEDSECSRLLMGDCATNIATRVLTNMSKGRGASLSFDTARVDKRNPNVTLYRPITHLSARSIGLYCALNKLQTVCIPLLSSKLNDTASINRLTGNFISGLEASFSSTVSTVCRTVEKVTVTDELLATEECVLCRGPMDVDRVPYFREPIEISIPTAVLPGEGGAGGCGSKPSMEEGKEGCGTGACGCKEDDNSSEDVEDSQTVNIREHLCYGCQRTMERMDPSGISIPRVMTQGVKQHMARAKMKEEIQDFLLPDCDES